MQHSSTYEHAVANPHYSHRFLDKFETMAFLHHANGIRMVTWYKTTAKHRGRCEKSNLIATRAVNIGIRSLTCARTYVLVI